MIDFVLKFFDRAMSQGFVPTFIRMGLMRILGYGVARGSCIWSHHTIRSNKIKLGRESFINIGFFFDGVGQLTIGDRVRIGQFVRILTATYEIGEYDQRCASESIVLPVTIEDGCWIGANVLILPGVIISKGCVVGAGSLVARSTEANCLYYGNPAKKIRRLDDLVSSEQPCSMASEFVASGKPET